MSQLIAFRVAQEPSPHLTTIYCVVSYWLDRGKLVEGKLQQFANMEAALRAGQAAGRRAPAVRVSRVRGNVEVDYWEEWVTVAKFGDRAADLPVRTSAAGAG